MTDVCLLKPVTKPGLDAKGESILKPFLPFENGIPPYCFLSLPGASSHDPESVFHASLFSRISFLPRVAKSLETVPITDQRVVCIYDCFFRVSSKWKPKFSRKNKTKQNKNEFAASVSSSDTRGGEKEKGKKKKEKYSSSVIRDSTGNWIWFVGDSGGCPEKWLWLNYPEH